MNMYTVETLALYFQAYTREFKQNEEAETQFSKFKVRRFEVTQKLFVAMFSSHLQAFSILRKVLGDLVIR